MLMQRDHMGTFKLLYAISRRTSEPESRYHSSKLELMAIAWAVNRLRPMLAHLSFTVVTDCQALCYLSTQKTLNPQMIRWNDLLSDYDYRIVHRAGVKLAHVDALSRAPVDAPDNLLNTTVMSILTEEDEVRLYQYTDPDLREKKETLSKPASERPKYDESRICDFELSKGILYKRQENRLLYVVPNVMRKGLTIRFHDLRSHQGAERTVSRIREHYYFPRMRAYVKRHIRSCLQCIACKSKPGRQAGELHPIPPGHRPFAVVHVDHLGPLASSTLGNKYVFALVDNLTKFAIIRAVRNTKTSHVIRVLEEVVRDYGAPIRLISDRGTSFTSKAFEHFCLKHGIRHTVNSPRHPQANGQIERLNATLVPVIQSNLAENDGRDWDREIRKIQCDLNEMKNASTGKSPFELVYGYVPRRDKGSVRELTQDDANTYKLPRELQNTAIENITSEQNKMKQRYDTNRATNVHFNVGDVVYMRVAPIATGESTKLQAEYRGPLIIVQTLPSDTYRIAELNDTETERRYASTVHASQLKIWKPVLPEPDDETFDADFDFDGNDNVNDPTSDENTCKREASTNEQYNSVRSAPEDPGSDELNNTTSDINESDRSVVLSKSSDKCYVNVPSATDECHASQTVIMPSTTNTSENEDERVQRKSQRRKRRPKNLADYDLAT